MALVVLVKVKCQVFQILQKTVFLKTINILQSEPNFRCGSEKFCHGVQKIYFFTLVIIFTEGRLGPYQYSVRATSMVLHWLADGSTW